MLDALYKMNLKVTDIIGTGTKMLHLTHKNLVFKDSLSFLNMALTNFSNTFGLEQLKKGWFPHTFSKLENLQYEGKIPALHYYEPQYMDKDEKKACEDWHAEEVAKGEVWNFKKGLLEYCKSDVKLLKEGCLKFAEDTKRDAGFNPLLQCITIASICHYFWRNFADGAYHYCSGTTPWLGWTQNMSKQGRLSMALLPRQTVRWKPNQTCPQWG